MYTDRGTHIYVNNDSMLNGLQEYFLGVRDELSYDREGNNIDACNYTIYVCMRI